MGLFNNDVIMKTVAIDTVNGHIRSGDYGRPVVYVY